MTTADEVAALRFHERERQEADRRYNDALTALDRAIVAAGAQPAIGRDDLASLGSRLLEFLQQITAYVDTKDRAIAASTGDRLAAIDQQVDAIAELRAQMAVVQRAVQALTRQSSDSRRQSSDVSHQTADVGSVRLQPDPPASGAPHPDDYVYSAFEDQFRGSTDAIADRLRAYVPLFTAPAIDGLVIDLGCGRGELLAALAAAGVRARGVDANADMVGIARDRGLDAVHGDALAFLDAQPDDSLAGLVATQVAEHLEPAYLMRLLDTAARKLRRGAPIAIETINAACWLAFFSSYIRDLTHVRPLHPDTLQFLLRAHGFARVDIRYSAPVPDAIKMRAVHLPPAVALGSDGAHTPLGALAEALNANAAILNNLMFTYLDYAAIGYRS